MRFSIEQVVLQDSRGTHSPATARYHVIEAESVDEAVAAFLTSISATAIGESQNFPGSQSTVTARAGDTVFSIYVVPGSDLYHRYS